MSTQLAFRTVAVVAFLAFAGGCLAAAANAQQAAPPPERTLVALGTGTAAVTPHDRKSNASILAAVRRADAKALPLALADARADAGRLAAAAGVTLGPLVSISNSPTTGGFFGPYLPTTGTFGPDKFCGTVRTRSVKVDRAGKRHYGPFRTRRTCRIPSTVQRAVQLTFALI